MNEAFGSATITLARAFVNKDSAHMYKNLMSQYQDGVKWMHIHNTGIEAVVLDMCHKQASGLGRYLASIDPSRTWDQHLQYSVQSIFNVDYSRSSRKLMHYH